MKDIIRLAVILMVICAVAATALAGTHGFTTTVISERQAAERRALLSAFIPDADTFEEPVEEDGYTFYIGRKAGELAGIAAAFTEPGFKGGIQMMLGVDTQGKITALEIMSQSETPGLGALIAEDNFKSQYAGKKQTDPIELGEDITAISGATVSSRAVTTGVRKAVDKIGAKYLGIAEPAEEPIVLTEIADGTYRGTGRGLLGDIVVDVTVEDHAIKDIKIVSEQETPEISGPAKKSVPARIIGQQTVEVDVESGATFTSKGIIEAVENALQELKQ